MVTFSLSAYRVTISLAGNSFCELLLTLARRNTYNTFLVKVLYTQRITVQGILHWVEQGRSLPFRSFLEMVHLLGEAIQTRQDMDQLKTWREGKSLQSKWR
ncbi:MAG TPA: hypothetical protein PK309_05170, partial [Bacillota bacterium]|nr:hypothetical protein [Bacillota bacterium]